MIKLEHVVLASPEQMKFIIEGMRRLKYEIFCHLFSGMMLKS